MASLLEKNGTWPLPVYLSKGYARDREERLIEYKGLRRQRKLLEGFEEHD
jgi:hypothetical protein